MKLLQIAAAAAAGLLSASLGAQVLTVDITGPGGHSSGDYGRVNAVHAAARSIEAIRTAVPEAVVTDLNGGATVNSIAADAHSKVSVPAEKAALVKEAVKKGCDAENAFRGVKEGESANGLRQDIRFSVK